MPICCRNFDEDGQPIRGGCRKGTECRFVHPDHPAWATGFRRQNSDVNSNWSSGPSPPQRSSWAEPNSHSKNWDTSLWGSSSGTSKKSPDSLTEMKWGSMTQSSTRRDATASGTSNDWNRASDKGQTSKSAVEGNSGEDLSWGTNATDGWGVDKKVGWGDSGGGNGGSGGGGWGGSGTSEWGGSTSEGLGQGKASDNISTVPNTNDPKGKGLVGSFKPIVINHNKQDTVAPPPPTRNAPPPSTTALKRPVPLLLPTKQKKTQPSEDGSLTKLALQCVKRPDKDAEQILSTKTARGPKGRADLFSQVIKHTSTVVLLQLELQRAQRDHARWKRTQESAQYERASHATRVILDHHRAQLNVRVQEAKRRLDRSLTSLVGLPDFASRNHKTTSPILTKETIAAYTAELRDWIPDLELHKRTLVEKAAGLPPAPNEGDSVTLVEPRLTARQFMERGNWSWKDMKNVTNELDTRLLAIAEHLYSDVYTTIADFKDLAVSLPDLRPTATRDNHSGTLSSTANLVGDNISAQAIRAADLISRIHELEQEYEQLESETQAVNKLYAEVEVSFSQFEQWKQEDRAKLQEMAEQLQKLHLRCKTPKSPTPALQPVQLEDILQQMKPILTERIGREVQPIFDNLRGRCLENHEEMKGLIEELVTPALVMTDDICHRVSAMSFNEASKSSNIVI